MLSDAPRGFWRRRRRKRRSAFGRGRCGACVAPAASRRRRKRRKEECNCHAICPPFQRDSKKEEKAKVCLSAAGCVDVSDGHHRGSKLWWWLHFCYNGRNAKQSIVPPSALLYDSQPPNVLDEMRRRAGAASLAHTDECLLLWPLEIHRSPVRGGQPHAHGCWLMGETHL